MEFYLLGKTFGTDFFIGAIISLGVYLFIKIAFRKILYKTSRAKNISLIRKYRRLEQLHYGCIADNQMLTDRIIVRDRTIQKINKELAYQVKNNRELGDTIYDLSQAKAALQDELADEKKKYEQCYIENDKLKAQMLRGGFVVDADGRIKERKIKL